MALDCPSTTSNRVKSSHSADIYYEPLIDNEEQHIAEMAAYFP